MTLDDLMERTIPEPNSGCWLWWPKAQARDGYGHIRVGRRVHLAYRLMYELAVGPIPAGLELDHKCRVPACCNPDHLDLVTHAENVARGTVGEHWSAKSHCPAGHVYDEENTRIFFRGGKGPYRACRQCGRDRHYGIPAARSSSVVRAKRDRIFQLHSGRGETFAVIAGLVGLTERHCAEQYVRALKERGLYGGPRRGISGAARKAWANAGWEERRGLV